MKARDGRSQRGRLKQGRARSSKGGKVKERSGVPETVKMGGKLEAEES